MFTWFEKRIDPFPRDQIEKPKDSLAAFCLHYTKGMGKWLAIMAICTALIAIIEVSLFGFLGHIVDWLTTSSPENFFAQHIYQLLFIGALILIGLPAIVALQNMIIHQTLMGNYPMRIRWSIHRYLLSQSLSYFQNESSGRICAKIMQTSLAVRETVMKLFDVLNYVIVYFSGTLILAAASDLRLMLPFAGWLIAYIGLLSYFIPRLRVASEKQADASTVMVGRIVDAYTNISTVKLFSHNSREEAYAKSGMQGYLTGVNGQMRLISQFSYGIYFLNCLLLFSVGTVGLLLWQKHLVMVGAVASAAGLALRLNGMSQWLMWEMSALFENLGIVGDGMRTIARDREVEDSLEATVLEVKKGTIEFKNVAFNHTQNRSLFDNFNLKIEAGQKVGIVGRSGAGKSTLVNLLLRFYNADSGAILIDGQNIAHTTQESLRGNIAMVSQDTSLLHRSLRENIMYGKPNASDLEMLQAAKDADALDFIQGLEDHKGNSGFDALVGERGAKLSGGQRQRIAISRLILKDAPILILDEATSALDSHAEAEIQQNLDRLMNGKTVLAIAHRLSTIAQMDRLIVMDGGKIVEDGTHEELLAKEGLYANLWKRQVGGHLILDKVA